MRKKSLKKISQTQLPASKTIEDNFFLIGGILFAAGILYAALYFLHPGFLPALHLPPCLFHLFTGYYCPGCGGTRAVRALLHGHLVQSIYLHPVVPYGAAIYLYFMVTQIIERLSRHKFRIGMRYHNCYAWIAVAIILINFTVKNILHHFYGFLL